MFFLDHIWVIPLLPIIAFAMAHTCPRWYDAAMQSIRQDRRQRWHTAAKAVVTIWLIGVVVAGCGVNWRSDVYSKIHRDVVNTLYRNTDPSLPVIADIPATVKFLNELHGRRMLAELTVIDAGHIQTLLDRYGSAQMVIFNRDDSDYWVSKANRNTALLDSLSMRFSCTRKLAQSFPGLGVVQIWNIRNR